MLKADETVAVVQQPSPLKQSESEQYCATVIIDFGKEITGYGWLDVAGNEGAIIDMVYGERLTGGVCPRLCKIVVMLTVIFLQKGSPVSRSL